ncbi:2-aminoethylphosphonate aminotransferase, partial [Burkholderia pseudomallei]
REVDEAGGWRARHARYAALAEQGRAGLAARGMPLVLPDGESSVGLRAYRLPAGVAYEQLHDGLKARGCVIFAGQGGLASAWCRVS